MTDNTAVRTVKIDLCDLCIAGKGGECHTPGCALWINRAPDLRIDTHPSFEIVPATEAAAEDALHEWLVEVLNYSPTDALVTNQHVEELAAYLLPLIRKRISIEASEGEADGNTAGHPLRMQIAAALIMHDHPEQNSLTRPDEPLVMLYTDPKFHVCAKALSQADAVLSVVQEYVKPPEHLVLFNGWTAVEVDYCTCMNPGPEWGHEPHCGLEPFAKIDTVRHDAQIARDIDRQRREDDNGDEQTQA